MVEVSTLGSDIDVFVSPTGGCIMRHMMVYAKSNSTTVYVKYNDRTTDANIATEASMAGNETWIPFASPLGMPSGHTLSVNTNEELNVLITYVEFS